MKKCLIVVFLLPVACTQEWGMTSRGDVCPLWMRDFSQYCDSLPYMIENTKGFPVDLLGWEMAQVMVQNNEFSIINVHNVTFRSADGETMTPEGLTFEPGTVFYAEAVNNGHVPKFEVVPKDPAKVVHATVLFVRASTATPTPQTEPTFTPTVQ